MIRKIVLSTFIVFGALISLSALLADFVVRGAYPGINGAQLMGILCGLFLTLLGILMMLKPPGRVEKWLWARISFLLMQLDAQKILVNVIAPLLLLIVYSTAFTFVSTKFLMEGVNSEFAADLSGLAILLLVVVYLFYFILGKRHDSRTTGSFQAAEKLTWSDLFLLLLPLTPVFQYTIYNRDILALLDILLVILASASFFAVFIFIIPYLLESICPFKTTKMLGLAFTFTIASMALLSHDNAWYQQGHFGIQVLFFAGTLFGLHVIVNLKKKILSGFIIVVFLINTTFQCFRSSASASQVSQPITDNRLISIINGIAPVRTPNIYLLIYDSYSPSETLLAYGIDNTDQEHFLLSQGFNLYPDIYSVAGRSEESMSKVLNVSHDYYGNTRRGASGDGVVHNILRAHGYDTYGIFFDDHMFMGIGSSYDISYPENQTLPGMLIISGIFIGEFRFDIGRGSQTMDQYLEEKGIVLNGIDPSVDHAFVYTHSGSPDHSQNSGACLPDETLQYKYRLGKANQEMRLDISTIIENDPGAIVIIAGDHGPGLTQNCTSTTGVIDISEISRVDIQDRYGTFLAIRWPTDDFDQYDEITVLQDIFPAVLAYMYEDPIILDACIEPVMSGTNVISGAFVDDGIIHGGIDDGEPLFLSGE